MYWFEGNFQDYEENRKKRLGRGYLTELNSTGSCTRMKVPKLHSRNSQACKGATYI